MDLEVGMHLCFMIISELKFWSVLMIKGSRTCEKMSWALISEEHNNKGLSNRRVCIFPENKSDLFVILICLLMPCPVNVLTAVVPGYGLPLWGRSFPEHELNLKARVTERINAYLQFISSFQST